MPASEIFKEIDPKIYLFDDNRIRMLQTGEITQLEFMRLTAMDDPWELHQGKLIAITPEIVEKRIKDYKKAYKRHLESAGGLQGTDIHKHREVFVKLYPEIKVKLNKAVAEIEKDKCSDCVLNGKMHPILQDILKLKPDGRDFSILPKMNDNIIKRLKGEEIDIKDEDIKIPPQLIKKDIPVLDEIPTVSDQQSGNDIKYNSKAVTDFNLGTQMMNDAFFTILDSIENPVASDALHEVEKKQQKLILSNGQAPGDILMMSAAVRDLKVAYGDRYLIDVRTPAEAVWENNPHLTKIDDNDPDALKIKMEYPIIHQSNEGPYHFIHGFRLFLEDKLNIKIPATKFWGDIHFTEEEKNWVSMIEQHYTPGKDTPFWLICTGGKTDYSAKWWIPEYAQKVVDHFQGKKQFVQFGVTGKGHHHPLLKNVINVIDKTDLRQFMRLMYHADGVVCPITFAMHLAAAMPQKPGKPMRKACVVTAGGREPSNFTAYTNHQFLHTNGCINCCDSGGCWKSRTEIIKDGDDHKNGELCENTINYKKRRVQKCMYYGVKPEDVIRAIEKYYINGNLKYLNEKD